MRLAAALLTLLCLFGCFESQELKVPLESGTYEFRWKDAEFSGSDGFLVALEISGNHVRVINERKQGSAPAGELERGDLMWDAKSNQWIVGNADSDKFAPEVGGCDGGPHVINFETREIWTCEWGP